MKRAQSGTTLRSMLGWALLLPLAVLLTTGCFRIEMSFVVNEDGSGVVGYTVGISDEFTALMNSMEGTSMDTADLPQGPPGSEVREYSEDGYTGFVMTLPFTDYAEVRPILAEWNQEGGTEVDLPDISQDENGDWRFSMTVPPVSEDDGSAADFGISEALFADGWFRVRAKLPGEIAEHNADRVENSELVWQIDLDSDHTEALQLTARSTAGGGLPVIAIGAAAAVAVIALAAVAILFFTRRGSAGRATG